MTSNAADYDLARQLQEKFDLEFAAAQSEANSEVVDLLPADLRTPSKKKPSEPTSLVAPEWEDLDPTPDLHALFLAYNDKFFWGRLISCEVCAQIISKSSSDWPLHDTQLVLVTFS